jgi:hypothetical protein
MRWPWTRPGPPPDALYASLRHDLEEVEHQVRMLKTEWLDTLEKLERVQARLTKRAERAQKAQPVDQERSFEMKTDPISARVWARRNASV